MGAQPPEKNRISDNQGYVKNICTRFHDKILNRNQGKYVYMPKLDPKIPQNGPQRTGAFSSVVTISIILETTVQKIK